MSSTIQSVQQAQQSATLICDAANNNDNSRDGAWPQVEAEARTLANALRSKDLGE
jgi:hypothetical protein